MTSLLTAAVAAIPRAELRGRDVPLHDATHDSHQVRDGWLFCCVPGSRSDGHDHAASAVERGADALLVERWLELDVPQARVPSVRAAMGPAAAAIHEFPSDRVDVVGITGTNGKTTTTYLVEAALAAGGRGTGVIGTVETRIHGEAQPGIRTTPEATDLQRLLAQMYARGVDGVAMEVSSHGLDMHRVDGTRYAVAAFTNLSQDHLDFHGSMEAYFDAKARLFTTHLAQRAVVCVDDEWGRRLAQQTTVPVVTYGRDPGADHRLVDVVSTIEGTSALLVGNDGRVHLSTRLLGAHNALNAAAAYLCARAVDVPMAAAVAGIAACAGVRGRLERVPGDGGAHPVVLVDYAHTPDALRAVVEAVRGLLPTAGRLHLVIGCGGERDVGKRPLMGAVAAGADLAVLTNDNPRSEDPEVILDAIEDGADQAVAAGARAKIVREPDRRSAIALAIEHAGPGDVVLVAGKGHETEQQFMDHTVAFDDRRVAADLLANARAGKP